MNKLSIKLQTAGSRLKYLRSMAQISRKEFEEKFQISAATLRSWEDEKVMVSDKNLKLCLQAYRSFGIITSIEWLKSGVTSFPTIKDFSIQQEIENKDIEKDQFENFASSKKLFNDAVGLINILLEEYNVEFNFALINKLALSLYEYSKADKKLCINYAKQVIKLLIDLNFLFPNSKLNKHITP